jgi:hypothetical protein
LRPEPRQRRRTWAGAALGLLLWGVAAAVGSAPVAAPANAQAPRTPSEVQIEAAYLVNFLRYTEWPARSFDAPDAPYVIAVVGDASVADSVRAVASAAARINGRTIEVRWIPGARGSRAAPFDSGQDRENLLQLRRSHLAFFHASAGTIPSQALSDLWGQPVLTVSDAPGFAVSGGMLGLVRTSGHIVFEANPVAIRNSHLLLSAKVLKLARLVRGSAQ